MYYHFFNFTFMYILRGFTPQQLVKTASNLLLIHQKINLANKTNCGALMKDYSRKKLL